MEFKMDIIPIGAKVKLINIDEIEYAHGSPSAYSSFKEKENWVHKVYRATVQIDSHIRISYHIRSAPVFNPHNSNFLGVTEFLTFAEMENVIKE